MATTAACARCTDDPAFAALIDQDCLDEMLERWKRASDAPEDVRAALEAELDALSSEAQEQMCAALEAWALDAERRAAEREAQTAAEEQELVESAVRVRVVSRQR